MSKCMASKAGICTNIYGSGTKCSGHSDRCSLKPHYDNLQRTAEYAVNSVKKAFGIKGDNE